MADRGLTSGVVDELSKSEVRIAVFVEVEFATGFLRIWSGVGDIIFQTNTYLGAGGLLTVRPASESSNLAPNGIEVTLDGVDPANISLALGEARQGKTLNCYLGFLDSSEALIADPASLFKGRVDTVKIDEAAETAKVTVFGESRVVDLQRIGRRRYTMEDQKRDFPSDLGMSQVNAIQEWQGDWGKPIPPDNQVTPPNFDPPEESDPEWWEPGYTPGGNEQPELEGD